MQSPQTSTISKQTMERVNQFFNATFQTRLTDEDQQRPFEVSDTSTGNSLQIWPPKYGLSWEFYQNHQANYWSAEEHEPLDDVNGFIKLSREWQNAVLRSFAVLAIGDDAVMKFINENGLEWEESTEWLFKDQGARETVHKIVYNKMLQLANHSSDYVVNSFTSDEFVSYIMGGDVLEFESSGQKKACFLIKMIFCERYLFAVPFLIINLLGETNAINTCVKINMQVMKDENVHYLHAVALLKDIKGDNAQAIDELFCAIGERFVKIVEPMVIKIGLELTDKQKAGLMDHARFTLREIYMDNGIESPQSVAQYTKTPFSVFDKNTGVDKFNVMESNSTVYKAVRGVYMPDWTKDDDEEVLICKRRKV
ncbi:ribonucleotide reductase subunit 2a [Epinotia aporema granulovirus]|uniref:ribonucleoside-diphosphate reductase n=1 Tax=Epinotia aporema granulovirus TaxID=166056 RepID=K4ER50_9BBAC|nr:ribonucleotide reductase subunit 2a [Epinotia aporema granulovirus]AER41429.1 ribonucleotide reductase subunit 2a [Epinotia aporema granulovirus]